MVLLCTSNKLVYVTIVTRYSIFFIEHGKNPIKHRALEIQEMCTYTNLKWPRAWAALCSKLYLFFCLAYLYGEYLIG